jgi:hypothetical protein
MLCLSLNLSKLLTEKGRDDDVVSGVKLNSGSFSDYASLSVGATPPFSRRRYVSPSRRHVVTHQVTNVACRARWRHFYLVSPPSTRHTVHVIVTYCHLWGMHYEYDVQRVKKYEI